VEVAPPNDAGKGGGWNSQRAGAENLIKEANNDAGLADHRSGRWPMNCILLSTRHDGLPPQLLADAVHSIEKRRLRSSNSATSLWQPLGWGPGSGSAHLAPRGNRVCQLQ
jgi:hypothetical protein